MAGVSMSLENVDEYEADIRRRNLLHLKREHSRLFDASAIAKRFRLTDTTYGENATGSRGKEGMQPSSDRLDGLTTDYGWQTRARGVDQSSRVEDNPDYCISGELVGAGNGGLENNFENTRFVKFKLLDVLRRCSLVTRADDAGSGPSEVPYSSGIEGEVQDDWLKDIGGRLESPSVQSPVVHCTSDDDEADGASDDIGHVCQVETPAINNVHQQGCDDRPLKMCHTVTSQLFSGQDSPGTGKQVDANLDVQFSEDVAGSLGHDSCGDDDTAEILSDSNNAGSHLSEKNKHLSSNQGQSVEESMVERQLVPTMVDYCTTNYDGMETICCGSFQSPVRPYSMRPRSSEKKE